MRLATAVVIVAASMLSACGTAGRVAAPVIGMVSGAKSAPAIAATPKGAPTMEVTLRQRGIKFPMSLLERKGPVSIWQASDGAQLFLRDGMVIGTRSFGLDLMSATVPSAGELVGGAATHSRTHHYLDGADSPVRRAYTCTTEPGTSDKGPTVAHHVVEICQSDVGRIRNEFWIDGGLNVVQSRQWVSQGVGYAEFVAR